MSRPEDVSKVVREIMAAHVWCSRDQECVLAFHLDRKNFLKHYTIVSLGTATTSLIHPREVFRAAIVAGAIAIVVAHNHPSGDPGPSPADVAVTRQLREAARAIDIEFLDHVIVGEPANDPRGLGYFSFREAGIL